MKHLIVGCGYVGRRVAKRWLDLGHVVYALTRSERRADELRQAGIRPLVGDVTETASLRSTIDNAPLGDLDTVLYSVGFDRKAGRPMRDVYVVGLANVMDRMPSTVRRIVYVSSTGVYGQDDGSWVNESSPCEPTREGGRICLEAERFLATHSIGNKAIVLRLAGIYGPGRIPKLDAIRNGQPVAASVRGYLNLIYVDDAVESVLIAASTPSAPDLFLIADGNPVERGEFYRELANQLAAPDPQFVEPTLGDNASQRASADKRIDSRRMRAVLGFSPQVVDYREGLAKILALESFTRPSEQ